MSDIATPLYEQIKNYLLHEIDTGVFKPHTQIPSERSLSEKFGVSRMTAKHAIRELVTEGRLYTLVGKGTFVGEIPITQQLESLTGFSQDMQSMGKTTSSRVLLAEKIEADEQLSTALRIPIYAGVLLLKRIRLANNQPVAVESSFLANKRCEGLLEGHDFSRESLYHVLQTQYQLHLSHADQSMTARLITVQECEWLEVPSGFPVLDITRTTYTENDIPIEYVKSVYRGDRYVFRARLKYLIG